MTEPRADEPLSLGDCILHRDHHPMARECWNAAIDFYAHASENNPDTTTEQIVRLYKAAYERAVLKATTTAAQGSANV